MIYKDYEDLYFFRQFGKRNIWKSTHNIHV